MAVWKNEKRCVNMSMALDRDSFRNEKITSILVHMAPPVMLAQLIQALYNIVDSFFIGSYSVRGLTALSIIYPVQLLMIAIAVGTGVGINTRVAYCNGARRYKDAEKTAGTGAPLAIFLWVAFSLIIWFILPSYAAMQTSSSEVVREAVSYGRIVTVLAPGLFLESMWTKVCQANGDMNTPMIGQILGALTNIALDPILIFGHFGLPEMGIAGAGIATVIGQAVAAGLMCFELIPRLLLSVFTKDADVLSIGIWGFRVIGWSFLPMVFSLTFPVTELVTAIIGAGLYHREKVSCQLS